MSVLDIPDPRYPASPLSRVNDVAFSGMNDEWAVRRIVRVATRTNTAVMRRDAARSHTSTVNGARDRPSPADAFEASGALDYEVALLALADAAAEDLAAGRAGARSPATLAESIAESRGVALAAVSLALFTRIALSPRLLQLPTERAVELQLGTLASLAGLTRVSLWSFDVGVVAQRFSFGEDDRADAERNAVERALGLRRREAEHDDGELVAGTVLRAELPAAVVVGHRASVRDTQIQAFIFVACGALALVLEREALLEHGSAAHGALVAAHERRLTRLAFDLHDGPLQEIAVMAADLHVARSRAEAALETPGREQVTGSYDGLLDRLSELDVGLREVAHSLETTGVVHHPLADVLRREIVAFERKSPIRARLCVTGDVDDLTDSQKIVLWRVVQEGLTNVREHSEASSVAVILHSSPTLTRLDIDDDGRGFVVDLELAESERRGRLGLVGAAERVRLLGGTFALRSSPGAGTRLAVSLPHWQS